MSTEVSSPHPADRSVTEILTRLRKRGPGAARYRLEGEVARGGMGAILRVWDDNLRRPMAMKVVLGDEGSATSGAGESGAEPTPEHARRLLRFFEEAQVTGQLEHPGIVPVHELGVDDDGRAYFTMQLVRGRDLEQVFRLVAQHSEGWTTTRAVGVLLRVCEAMAFAHDRKVLHRDLKPANVMVGSFGEVYVMDWGIARVLGEPDSHDVRLQPVPQRESAAGETGERVATDRHDRANPSSSDLYTMDGDVVGTPAYMSPEQARGMIEQLDARADVYSIGAMLYRLLAGEAPYERSDDGSAYSMLRELLRGPPTPLGRLAPEAPAELVAIAEQAMAHDPAARYPTMSALADDLRAFLDNRVVAAYETGAWAEARKWIGRNKALAASLLVAVLLLAGGLATSLVFADRAEQAASRASAAAELAQTERQAAIQSSARAEREAAVARAVNAFLNDDVLAAIAPERMGAGVTMHEVLQQASRQLDFSFRSEPAVEAALRMTIGTSFSRLGDAAAARPHFARALQLRGPGGAAEEITGALEARLNLARAAANLGDTTVAEADYRAARDASVATLGAAHSMSLSADNDLALLYQAMGRRDEARDLFERTLAAMETEFGHDAESTMTTRANLGQLLTDLGEHAAADAMLVEALDSHRALLGPHHPLTLDCATSLAVLRIEQDRLEEAETMLADLLRLRSESHGADHIRCGSALSSLGYVRSRLARHAEAIDDLERAVALLRTKLGDDHAWTLLASNNLAGALVNAGRLADAMPIREATLEGQQRTLGPEHPSSLLSMSNLASLYNSLGRRDDAIRVGRETLAIQERVLGVDHPDTLVTRENLGGALFAVRDFAGSIELVQQVLDGRRRTLGDDHPAVTRTMFNLAMLRKSTGAADEAERLFREVLERNRRELPEGHPMIADALAQLGSLRNVTADYAGAEPLWREALAIRRQTFAADAPEVTLLLHDLAVLRFRQDDLDGAIVLMQEALDLRRAAHGDEHAHPMLSRFVLGEFLRRAARYDEAEPLLLRYHDWQVATKGADSAETKGTAKNIADLYDAMGRADDAARWRDSAR